MRENTEDPVTATARNLFRKGLTWIQMLLVPFPSVWNSPCFADSMAFALVFASTSFCMVALVSAILLSRSSNVRLSSSIFGSHSFLRIDKIRNKNVTALFSPLTAWSKSGATSSFEEVGSVVSFVNSLFKSAAAWMASSLRVSKSVMTVSAGSNLANLDHLPSSRFRSKVPPKMPLSCWSLALVETCVSEIWWSWTICPSFPFRLMVNGLITKLGECVVILLNECEP